MKQLFINFFNLFKTNKENVDNQPGFIKRMMEKIGKSTKDHLGKESASRIGYYIFVLLIMLITLTGIAIEIGNAYHSWTAETWSAYQMSNEFLGLLMMLIGQLSILLNIKKNSESTPFPSLDNMNSTMDSINKMENEINTTVKKPIKKEGI